MSLERYFSKIPTTHEKSNLPSTKKYKMDTTVTAKVASKTETEDSRKPRTEDTLQCSSASNSSATHTACSSASCTSISVTAKVASKTGTEDSRKPRTEDTLQCSSAGNSSATHTACSSASCTSTSVTKRGFQFRQVEGDLFQSPAMHSLAHCVSEDLHMGKGIAKIFRSKFGGVQELKDQEVKTGGVAVLKKEERFIYYLITKSKYWQKPTYNTLQGSLEAMANHCNQHQVTHVSMPLIGCGLDKLKWDTVADIIRTVFKDTNITVTVYELKETKKNNPSKRR